MYTIQIRTIGEVALKSDIDTNPGYRYDVPLDTYGVPYIPLYKLVDFQKEYDIDVKLGFAYPDGYPGIINAAGNLHKVIPNSTNFVQKIYTTERFIEDKQYSIRTINPELVFEGNVDFDKKYFREVKEALSKVKRIGIIDDGITGEVRISIKKTPLLNTESIALDSKCQYESLEISYMTYTPTCLYAPYEDGDKTYKYISGDVIRKSMYEIGKSGDIDFSGMVFSNAYLSYDKVRLLPSPICASVVKLDKEELRYRLSDGKDYSKVEQDAKLGDAYTVEYDKQLMRYASPRTTRITVDDKNTYDALAPGQIFKGFIYGTDKQIRKGARLIANVPFINIGRFTNEGFGSIYQYVAKANEKELSSEIYSRRFDVLCVSDVYLINDKGMNVVSADDLLREIEYTLGVSNCLEIQGKYTEVYFDHTYNQKWNSNNPVNRCIKKGSIIRVCVKDEPVEISRILHCFIGERTSIGYGEIIVYPAKDSYYRRAQEIDVTLYDTEFGNTIRDTIIGTSLMEGVLTSYSREIVKNLAIIDKQEYRKGILFDKLVPIEVLKRIKNLYIPHISVKVLIQWYKEELIDDINK